VTGVCESPQVERDFGDESPRGTRKVQKKDQMKRKEKERKGTKSIGEGDVNEAGGLLCLLPVLCRS
jgi:hypothetical protein